MWMDNCTTLLGEAAIIDIIFQLSCRLQTRPQAENPSKGGGEESGVGGEWEGQDPPKVYQIYTGPDAGTVILNGRVGGHRALKVSAHRERGRVSAAGEWLDELSSELRYPNLGRR
jgi:hypothetical protein